MEPDLPNPALKDGARYTYMEGSLKESVMKYIFHLQKQAKLKSVIWVNKALHRVFIKDTYPNYLKRPQYKRFEALNDASEKIRVRQALKAMLLKQGIKN